MSRFLIGDRFLVDSYSYSIVDTERELHNLIGKRGEIFFWFKDSHVKFIKGELFWVFKGECGSKKQYSVVIKDNKIVSVIVERRRKSGEFVVDVKHFGEKFQHRWAKEDYYFFAADHIFIGNKVSVAFYSVREDSSLKLYFQGGERNYSGKIARIIEGNGVVNIYVASKEEANVYVVFPDGEECLVYKGPRVYDFPIVHRISDRFLIVYCENENAQRILRFFSPPIGFYPIFLRRMRLDERYFISLNLKRWEKIDMNCRLILPEVIELWDILPDDPFRIPLEEALKKFAKKLDQELDQRRLGLGQNILCT